MKIETLNGGFKFADAAPKLCVFVLSCVLLAWQIRIEIGLFGYEEFGFLTDHCAAYLEKIWFAQWFFPVATSIHFFAAVLSLARYKTFGWAWWYVTLPSITAFAYLPLRGSFPTFIC